VTYSIVARCARTGQLGAAGTTSDLGLGARVPWLAAGVGAVVTQHRTDPRLGPLMLAALASGASAEAAVQAAAATEHARWRQLAAIGRTAPPAAFSGELVDPRHATQLLGADYAVVGNGLAGPEVGPAIGDAFAAQVELPLAERLLRALQAGLDAGGELWPLRSAYLSVVDTEVFPLVGLRVDEHAAPLTELRRLWTLYRPWVNEFVVRAIDPDRAAGIPEELAEEPAAVAER
jgi:uncharacterized Ntn-hydrolase superfamily protein